MKICIDSNVFISIHNRESNHLDCERIIDDIELKRHQGIISMITVSEILTGYYKIGDISEMNLFLAKMKYSFELIPVSLEIAQEAAEMRAIHNIKLPDAIIIATGKINNADFIISNDIELEKKTMVPIITAEDFSKRFFMK